MTRTGIELFNIPLRRIRLEIKSTKRGSNAELNLQEKSLNMKKPFVQDT